MKSLILGHTGFVGKRLFEYLTAQGHSVVGLSTAECDLRDYNSFYEAMREIEKVDVIYNLAAKCIIMSFPVVASFNSLTERISPLVKLKFLYLKKGSN